MKTLRSYKVQRFIQAIHFSLMVAGGAVLIIQYPSVVTAASVFLFLEFFFIFMIAITAGMHIVSSALNAFMHHKTSILMAIASKVLLMLAVAGYMTIFRYAATTGITELTWWSYWLYPALAVVVLLFPLKPPLRDKAFNR